MATTTILDTFGCQGCAFEIRQNGEAFLNSCFSEAENASKEYLNNALMACEIIAAAGGHPVKENQWCFFAEQWLFESKYQPTDELISKALNFAQSLEQQKLEYNLIDLIERLKANTKKTKFKKATIGANEISRFAKEQDGKVAWSRAEADLFIGLDNLTTNLQRLIPFEKFKSIRLLIEQPPIQQQIDSFRIFLLASKHTLENIEFSRTIPGNQADTDPLKILKTSTSEIGALPNLKGFLCDYVYADNSVVEAASHSKALRRLRMSNHSLSNIDAKALPFLLQCKNLRMVNIGHAGFPLEAALKLNKAMPNVNILGHASDKIVTPDWVT